MLKVDCKNCVERCCTSEKRPLIAALMPGEEKKFKNFYEKAGSNSKMKYVLKKTPEGNCVFLKEFHLCTIHRKKPLACQIFPLGIKFNENKISSFLKKMCPQSSKVTKKEIKKTENYFLWELLKLNYPELGKKIKC